MTEFTIDLVHARALTHFFPECHAISLFLPHIHQALGEQKDYRGFLHLVGYYLHIKNIASVLYLHPRKVISHNAAPPKTQIFSPLAQPRWDLGETLYLLKQFSCEWIPKYWQSVIINIIPRNDSDLNFRGLFRTVSIIYDEAFCENWFAIKINWLVSIWWGTLVVDGLTAKLPLFSQKHCLTNVWLGPK